jgi:hypothetical protein
MDLERFWKIVESSRRVIDSSRADGNMERQKEELRRLLLRLPVEEITSFRDHLFEQMDAAFHWDLWGGHTSSRVVARMMASLTSERG